MYRDDDFKRALSYMSVDYYRGNMGRRSDVTDGTEYKRLRRSVGSCKHFIVLAYCADAIPADKRLSRSILPGIIRCEKISLYYIHSSF